MIIKEQLLIKLFGIIPLYSQCIRERNKTLKILGLPLLKVYSSADNKIYYSLGIPFIKIKLQKTTKEN